MEEYKKKGCQVCGCVHLSPQHSAGRAKQGPMHLQVQGQRSNSSSKLAKAHSKTLERKRDTDRQTDRHHGGGGELQSYSEERRLFSFCSTSSALHRRHHSAVMCEGLHQCSKKLRSIPQLSWGLAHTRDKENSIG